MIRSFLHNTKKATQARIRDAALRRRRLLHHFNRTVTMMQSVISVLAVAASLFCLIELTLYFGFERSSSETITLKHLLRIPQGVFMLDIIFSIIVGRKLTDRKVKIINHLINAFVVVSVITWIYPRPSTPWIPVLDRIIYSNGFLFAVLASYSVLELCRAVMRLIGRRTNPALILSGSFIVFIFIGSFLLMLPKCTTVPISYTDSLFLSTSAVCITGLTPVDIPSTLTPLGLLVLSSLIQIGGLGVITFTSFFAIFFSGAPSIYSQLMIKDMLYSKTINNLIPTLLYILTFTVTVELIGAAAVYLTIPSTLGLPVTDKIIFAGFHSLSSFCNAGFSCLPGGMANRALMNGTQSIYVVTSILIFAGAIGFPILVNFKDIFVRRVKRLFRHQTTDRPVHIYDLNTKLVLVTTITILLIGSIAFFILEYNNTLAGMSIDKKIIQSVFNSLIPRSAGFDSLNPGMFMPVTMLLIVIQMWIGGASQSLAGGIKVNTFATVLLNLRAVIRGHAAPTAFGRRISNASVRRANTVLIIAILSFISYAIAIMLLEPQLPVKSILFEITSALFTVGSSLGITDQLSDISKIILSTAMFAGRVGILSLLIGFASQQRDVSPHYPADSIIIS